MRFRPNIQLVVIGGAHLALALCILAYSLQHGIYPRFRIGSGR